MAEYFAVSLNLVEYLQYPEYMKYMRVKLGASTCGIFSLFCEPKVWLFLRVSLTFWLRCFTSSASLTRSYTLG